MSGSGLVSSTTIACAYARSLFEDLYGDKTKEGYHIELQLSAMGTCQNNNPITISLNNISFNLSTWSNAMFRVLRRSERFRPSDIVYETTTGFSQQGCNLKYEVTGSAGYTWQFWDVTIHAFLVEDSPTYKWQRIS